MLVCGTKTLLGGTIIAFSQHFGPHAGPSFRCKLAPVHWPSHEPINFFTTNYDDYKGDLAMKIHKEWEDATFNLEEVKTIPVAAASPTAQEEAMICDLQRILGSYI